MTLPQLLRFADEADHYATRQAEGMPAHGQPRPQDLTKMTADQAAAELRKYGFG